jgi:hypothetical protein
VSIVRSLRPIDENKSPTYGADRPNGWRSSADISSKQIPTPMISFFHHDIRIFLFFLRDSIFAHSPRIWLSLFYRLVGLSSSPSLFRKAGNPVGQFRGNPMHFSIVSFAGGPGLS